MIWCNTSIALDPFKDNTYYEIVSIYLLHAIKIHFIIDMWMLFLIIQQWFCSMNYYFNRKIENVHTPLAISIPTIIPFGHSSFFRSIHFFFRGLLHIEQKHAFIEKQYSLLINQFLKTRLSKCMGNSYVFQYSKVQLYSYIRILFALLNI